MCPLSRCQTHYSGRLNSARLISTSTCKRLCIKLDLRVSTLQTDDNCGMESAEPRKPVNFCTLGGVTTKVALSGRPQLSTVPVLAFLQHRRNEEVRREGARHAGSGWKQIRCGYRLRRVRQVRVGQRRFR